LAQTFSSADLKADTCTAARIHPPEPPCIENALASMRPAFTLGAEIAELDIHPTADGQFAVFHDWTVDCRTKGKGVRELDQIPRDFSGGIWTNRIDRIAPALAARR
jgi:glycerophosphoryl diester phosphodiesterase